MSRFVVDASVALKWLLAEPDSAAAVRLARVESLLAPDLIVAEIGNALWKAVRRGELTPETARLAGRLFEQSPVDLRPMRSLLDRAISLAIRLDHPAYDCIYLVLAEIETCPLVTADERLVRKLLATPVGIEVLGVADAAARLGSD